jgi:DNA-binding response OmpR family regulator
MPAPLILLVDDEENLLFGLSAVMHRAGFQVITARNGSSGLIEAL